MNLRTAKRQWVRSADTNGSFFVDTSVHAQQLGLLQPPSTPAGDAAFLAAGLSDVAAASNGSSSNGSHNGVLAGLGSPERIAAAISSADAEMQAHIAAQSLSVDIQQASTAGSSSNGRSRAKTPDLSQKELLKFVRDFEPVPIPSEDMLWGLQGDAVRHR
jgi:hypothetical protein